MEVHSDRYDYPLSAAVAIAIQAEPYRCWRNAALAVILLPELFAFGMYVEGWAVTAWERVIEVFAHGWSLTPGHRIVDPTSVLTEESDQPMAFFPGRALSRPSLCRLIAGSTLPLICHSQYGDDGMAHPGYKQAFEGALRYARELAVSRGLLQSAIKVLERDPRRGVTVIVDPPPPDVQ